MFLLQNFDKSCLKLSKDKCGQHSYHYPVNYKKFDKYLPLLFVIPHFYGRFYEIDGRYYLYMTNAYENFNAMSDYEKLIIEIIKQINQLNDSKEYTFKKDYCRINVSCCIKKMPVGATLKISYAVIMLDLVGEGKYGLLVEGFLQECFYESLNEEDINDAFEIIENKK